MQRARAPLATYLRCTRSQAGSLLSTPSGSSGGTCSSFSLHRRAGRRGGGGSSAVLRTRLPPCAAVTQTDAGAGHAVSREPYLRHSSSTARPWRARLRAMWNSSEVLPQRSGPLSRKWRQSGGSGGSSRIARCSPGWAAARPSTSYRCILCEGRQMGQPGRESATGQRRLCCGWLVRRPSGSQVIERRPESNYLHRASV